MCEYVTCTFIAVIDELREKRNRFYEGNLFYFEAKHFIEEKIISRGTCSMLEVFVRTDTRIILFFRYIIISLSDI